MEKISKNYSELSRYDCYLFAYENLEKLNLENGNNLKKMYLESANLIKDLENNSEGSIQFFYDILNSNISRINDFELIKELEKSIFKQDIEDRTIKDKNYKTLLNNVLSVVVKYQNRYIEGMLIKFPPRKQKNQVFLSYAYYDKGITLYLYLLFYINGVFLYVNWMWEQSNSSGVVTKQQLEIELQKSKQLLFLRTLTSELRIQGGGHTIRQWCAWEIGNFYTKHPNDKYFVNFYNSFITNDLLDSFKPFIGFDSNGYMI